MEVEIALGVSFGGLLIAAHRGISVFWPLLVALGLITLVYRGKGTSARVLFVHMRQGVQSSAGVVGILLLIGIVVASWLAAGTVPALVFYGLQLIHPRWFLVLAFGLTGAMSVLLGTSFGTVGTMGLALMIMARGGGVPEGWAAGAIIAGAYVGDRCSPMSSSAHLVAAITQTSLRRNLAYMASTAWGALVLSLGIYAVASLRNPLQTVENSLIEQIPAAFSVHPLVLLPAALLIVLTVARCPVKPTLWLSCVSAVAIALTLQSQSVVAVFRTLMVGSVPVESDLGTLFQGGGLLAMGKVCAVVMVSTALAGLLLGMGTFDRVGQLLALQQGDRGRFGGTLLASLLTSAFGCTQTIAILLTGQIVQPRYDSTASSSERQSLAIDLENSAVVLAPLVPWNIAGLVPATVLLTDASFIPYAVYLYLLPLWHWLFYPQAMRSHFHPPSSTKGHSRSVSNPQR